LPNRWESEERRLLEAAAQVSGVKVVETGKHKLVISENARRAYLVSHPLSSAALSFPTSDLDEVIDEMQSRDLELSVVSGFDFYRNPMKLLAGVAIAQIRFKCC